MTLNYRKIQSADIERMFVIRASTRENPISKERLAQMGVTPESMLQGLEREHLCGWVCLVDNAVVGFCCADLNTGEVLVLALLPEFEGQGIGRQLLNHVVAELKEQGTQRIWLAADSDPAIRAYGFYRKLGWVPTGERLANGDEVLILQT